MQHFATCFLGFSGFAITGPGESYPSDGKPVLDIDDLSCAVLAVFGFKFKKQVPARWCPSSLAKLVNITPITMVYGRYIYTILYLLWFINQLSYLGDTTL